MKKNDERIWEVLIEDALQEQPVESAPPGDRTRRLLQPVGPLGIDRGRSMRHGGRRKWVPIAVAVGALVLVAAILYGGAVWLPKLSEANQPNPDQPRAAEQTNQSPSGERQSNHQEANNGPADTPEPTPEPQPEPLPEPTPNPTPQPEEPDPLPEPSPEPKPDDTVEQPDPQPQPDDTVEQPKEPEDTTPGPTPEQTPDPAVRLLHKEKRAALQFAEVDESGTDKPNYVDAEDRAEFPAQTWLSCRAPVDLEIGGAFLRLKGEAKFDSFRQLGLVVRLQDDDLFVDSRGAARWIEVQADGHYLDIRGAALLIENRVTGLEVSVYSGQVELTDDDENPILLPEGKRSVIKKRGIAGGYDLRNALADEPFLAGLGSRVVYRENFDDSPVGRLREGQLERGVVSGPTVFWGYPENIAFEPGLVIRLRVRFTDTSRATLTQFCEERNDNYSIDLEPGRHRERTVRNDEWYVLEVPVDQFVERSKHEGHPQVGESFMNVSLQLEGENARVELDWVELIRAVK